MPNPWRRCVLGGLRYNVLSSLAHHKRKDVGSECAGLNQEFPSSCDALEERWENRCATSKPATGEGGKLLRSSGGRRSCVHVLP
mmetsp:Transcript_48445/g.123344  ORF Transcript_48445/g.123344 Transcript_48445/m.123344 type:complete len:84 (-) Transcript_48445:681-932(-)